MEAKEVVMTKTERFLSEVFEQNEAERYDEEFPDMEPAGWSYGYLPL